MVYYPPNYPQEKEQFLKNCFLFLIKKNPKTRANLFKEMLVFAKKNHQKKVPKLWHLYFVYQRYFSNKKINQDFLKLFQVVKIRSLSGIVPLSCFTKPQDSCPFHCLYCPTVKDAPKSYFPDEAAVMRAIRADYDPFRQVQDRLIQFYLSGHPIDKIEVIIQGGTFSFYPKDYRQWFVKRVFDALNTQVDKLIKEGKTKFYNDKNLELAKKRNEKSYQRMVGLTIETRPDFINEQEIIFLRKLGVTRIELGVQTIDEKILKINQRGHNLNAVKKATRLLRDAGFKITYHLMPGLPGSSFKKDLQVLKKIFNDQNFKPDNIKFYPTQIVKNSQLADWYQNGKYQPISKDYLIKLTLAFKKKIVPHWVRINRLVRDLTRNDLVIETFPSNFRQELETQLKINKINCPCIRCREIRNKKIKSPIKLKTTSYLANQGKEFFLEYLDQNNQLLGYLRLRLPSFLTTKKNFFIKALNHSAIIRELHVLGELTPIKKKGRVQHQGLGKKLIEEAIKIVKKNNLKKISVIAAVGTRQYYKKLGFKKQDEYLVKNI